MFFVKINAHVRLFYLLPPRIRVARDQTQPGSFSRERKEPGDEVVLEHAKNILRLRSRKESLFLKILKMDVKTFSKYQLQIQPLFNIANTEGRFTLVRRWKRIV